VSSSSEFSAHELESLALWRLPPVSKRPASPVEDHDGQPPEPAPAVTAESIENLQRQAYEEAAVSGRQEGYKEGYQEGHRAGFEQGHSEGLESGRAEGVAEIREMGEHFGKLMALLCAPLKELDEHIEQELVALAIAIAKQLVRREFKADPGNVVAVVRQALAVLPASTRKVSLHLHPEDAELVRSALALEETSAAWKIVEDPVLARGGCRVDTETSRIDATLEKRLASVAASLLGGERDGDDAR
jgi:flagellar assembly protein FliH